MSWTSSYQSALRQLSTASLYAEVHKLENSIKHLRRSNEELKLHCNTEAEDTSWIIPIIEENEQVIEKQSDQVKYVRQEIFGRAVENEWAGGDLLTKGSISKRANESGVELNDAENGNGEQVEVDGHSNGLHL